MGVMLPDEYCLRMKELLRDEYDAFMAEYEKAPLSGLRINPLKRDRSGKTLYEKIKENEELKRSLGLLSDISWAGASKGYYYNPEAEPGKQPLHAAGAYYIQEPSAMSVVPLLKVKPGERVLDLCAAPGGKSTQIAEYLRGKGLLFTNEINSSRARILSENIERMGIGNAIVSNESPKRLLDAFPEYFDRVLVDAPCSGEGMFRKNNEAIAEWSAANVELCGSRQDEILDIAAGLLRTGGRLVYSTCTFERMEDEGAVERFLERHTEFKCLDMHRIMPHREAGEGHFAAVLIKGEELEREDVPAVSDAVREVGFGDNIYEVPVDFPDVRGLKILRCGLHTGIKKKGRTEPAHAAALAADMTKLTNICDLKAEDIRVRQYLNGQTFAVSDKEAVGEGSGWYIICTEGFSLGWGKLVNGTMKNHYPKGLRINYQYI